MYKCIILNGNVYYRLISVFFAKLARKMKLNMNFRKEENRKERQKKERKKREISKKKLINKRSRKRVCVTCVPA